MIIRSSFLVLSFFTFTVRAQTYTLPDLERHFLQNNYSLIAEKFNINRADAEMLQEKRWPNPRLNVSEVNLWGSAGAEQLPPIFGTYGKTQQISVGLEQLIVTAGKRKKRVKLKELEKKSAFYEYEELILTLKRDLRTHFYELQNIKLQRADLDAQWQLFKNLEEQYSRQSALQNVAVADYLRIQAEVRLLQTELMNLRATEKEKLTELEILTQLPLRKLEDLDFSKLSFNKVSLLPATIDGYFIDTNPNFLNQKNKLLQAEKFLDLAQAEKTPDLIVQLDYDRGGNIMQDFVGLGFSIDLPVFNTNKGNISAAKYTVQKSSYEVSALKWQLQAQITKTTQQLAAYEEIISNWAESEAQGQDKIIQNYQKQFQNRQVTLLEMLDFMQAVRSSRFAKYDLQQDYYRSFENLQYLIGKDL